MATLTELCAPFRTPAREVYGEVRAFIKNDNGAYTEQTVFTPDGSLVKMVIERSVPAGKYFGYTVSHKLTLELLGKHDFSDIDHLIPYLGAKGYDLKEYQWFFIENVSYDKVSKKTNIVAYDIINQLNKFSMREVDFGGYPTTVRAIGEAIAARAGASGTRWPSTGIYTIDLHEIPFSGENGELVNITGEETGRAVAEDIAEVIGGYCVCLSGTEIIFSQFSSAWFSDENTLKISESDYFEFTESDGVKLLTQVAFTNSLGDVIYSGEKTDDGGVQTLHENCFLELRDEDKGQILDIIFAAAKKSYTNKTFTMKTRGFPFVKFYDIYLIPLYINENGNQVSAGYIPLNETLTYDGGLSAVISTDIDNVASFIEGSPTSLGEAIKNTITRIDRVNAEIEFVTSETSDMRQEVTDVKISTDGIIAYVESTVADNQNTMAGMVENVNALTQRVEAVMTSEQLAVLVKQEVANGVDSVTTSTGFTFNSEGLKINKSGTEMNTLISEDGMLVSRGSTALLTADHLGVTATNLHAKTYLLIGTTSRLEDYDGGNRTGCFWMGQG